jgi:hypothetical protein
MTLFLQCRFFATVVSVNMEVGEGSRDKLGCMFGLGYMDARERPRPSWGARRGILTSGSGLQH